MIKKNLLPHVHVIKLIGGTGDGKTELSAVFAAPIARKTLLRCVGRTNSTVRERMLVYTDAINDRIIVAVTLNEEILDRNIFSDLVTTAIAKVIRGNGKVAVSFVGKDEEDLERALFSGLEEKNNTTAVLNFLTEEQKEEFVKQIVEVYRKYNFHSYDYEVYNTTKNNLHDKEVKENSNKFLAALRVEVERVINLMNKEFTNELYEIWKETNKILKEKFLEYFSETEMSGDGLYYKEVYFDDPDKNFVEAMFTANDLQGGQKLSLEVLCGQIYIYVPMNMAVSRIIQRHPVASKVFSNEYGHCTFGITDTRGLYHTGIQKGDNGDYLSELMYQGEADAIAMVVPLQGDSNEKKIYELYRNLLEGYNKQIPIFMVNNKVDLYIDELRKEECLEDPFSTSMNFGEEMGADEIIEKVSQRVNELKCGLQLVQGKARKNMEIISLPCYLKRDEGMKHREVVEKYNIAGVVEKMLVTTAASLEQSSVKVVIKVKDEKDVEVSIDEKILKEKVHNHVLKADTSKKVFQPGCTNLGENIGICPHGNSYLALRRRVRYGMGYSCNIDEGYYYKCRSFTVSFTGNLKNFITDDLVSSLLVTAVNIENGVFATQNDGEQFNELVKRNVNPYKLVSILLFNHAMRDAEKAGFGFEAYFQGFIKNSMQYFQSGLINEEHYYEAVKTVIMEAVERTIAMNVVYK